MSDSVRVRYAPSPTGMPHVGNIRTALFNWLFARHHGGSFIVRIEDTDRTRLVEGAVDAIHEGLRWLGIDWDEGPGVGGEYGPYFQSERLDLYQEAARRLVEQGNAYYCYCSSDRLEQMRAEQTRLKQPTGYDRRCCYLTPEEQQELGKGVTPVVRFRAPLEGQTIFNDLIRGDICFENTTIDDFVLLKSDGFPTYHLANVVDDHRMRITHVLRADEWLASTPRHKLLYQALGYEPPLFAHLPMILGPDRSKLSKRHGATFILEYRDKGYLPEAMMNFLALLGWSLDDKTEIISKEDLIKHFDIGRIGKTGAIFSLEKLDWMNGMYIRKLSPPELAARMLPFLEKDLPAGVQRPLSREYVARIVPLVQDRLKTLAESAGLTDFLFLEDVICEASLLVPKKTTPEQALKALQASLQKLHATDRFDYESLEAALRPLAAEIGLETGQMFGALRVAVTGRTAAPPLFQTMEVLGKDHCLKRIRTAIAKLESAAPKA